MNRGMTSFRALAFFAVFMFHMGRFSAGYLGVQAFFVLSGFLLTPILLDMKANLSPKQFFVSFYGRRALRIFPLYYFYLLAVTIICLWVLNTNVYADKSEFTLFMDQLPWSLTYTYNFFSASSLFENSFFVSHLWSLAVEEQFYLLWPLLIFLVRRDHLTKVLWLTIFLGPVFRFATGELAGGAGSTVFNSRLDFAVYVLPFSHIDAFAIGGLFASYKSSGSKWPLRALIVAALTIGYTTQYLAYGEIMISSLGFYAFMVGKYVWGYSLMNLVFACMLLQIRDEKFLPRFFNGAILHYLGKISYGMYVFHFPAIHFSSELLDGQTKLVIGCVALAATIAISALSYELVEKRFIAQKDRFFSKRSQAEA